MIFSGLFFSEMIVMEIIWTHQRSIVLVRERMHSLVNSDNLILPCILLCFQSYTLLCSRRTLDFGRLIQSHILCYKFRWINLNFAIYFLDWYSPVCFLHRFGLPLALRLPSSEELHAGTTTSSDVCLEPELEPDSNSRCQVQVKDRKANRARAIGVGARLWFGCLQPPSLDGSLLRSSVDRSSSLLNVSF